MLLIPTKKKSGNSIAINIELRPNIVKGVDCPSIYKML